MECGPDPGRRGRGRPSRQAVRAAEGLQALRQDAPPPPVAAGAGQVVAVATRRLLRVEREIPQDVFMSLFRPGLPSCPNQLSHYVLKFASHPSDETTDAAVADFCAEFFNPVVNAWQASSLIVRALDLHTYPRWIKEATRRAAAAAELVDRERNVAAQVRSCALTGGQEVWASDAGLTLNALQYNIDRTINYSACS
eukprot:9485369-Pyramimonas_sp.AAC.1